MAGENTRAPESGKSEADHSSSSAARFSRDASNQSAGHTSENTASHPASSTENGDEGQTQSRPSSDTGQCQKLSKSKIVLIMVALCVRNHIVRVLQMIRWLTGEV
jgi:hypothetical protein